MQLELWCLRPPRAEEAYPDPSDGIEVKSLDNVARDFHPIPVGSKSLNRKPSDGFSLAWKYVMCEGICLLQGQAKPSSDFDLCT